MKLHSSITEERIIAAVKSGWFGLENPGICRACGEDQGGCEPDAENYRCESCDEREVFGAEELMVRYFG